MIYNFNGKTYIQQDLDDMSDEELTDLKLDASKYARDIDLLIENKKAEWEDHGRDPAYGLSNEEFKRYKLLMKNALALVDTIKAMGL